VECKSNPTSHMYVACRMLLVARVFRVPSLWDMRHNNITFKGSEKRQEGVKRGQETACTYRNDKYAGTQATLHRKKYSKRNISLPLLNIRFPLIKC